jgi:hypothetical protein
MVFIDPSNGLPSRLVQKNEQEVSKRNHLPLDSLLPVAPPPLDRLQSSSFFTKDSSLPGRLSRA